MFRKNLVRKKIVDFFQKSFDELFSKAPARIRSACRLEFVSNLGGSGLQLNCKNINDTRDFLLEDDSTPDLNPNAIVVDDRSARESAMLELADRIVEIVIRDSHVGCVDVFTDFQKFKNLRRLSIIRSHLRHLNEECDADVGDVSGDADRRRDATSNPDQNSLQFLEVLDISENVLTRF